MKTNLLVTTALAYSLALPSLAQEAVWPDLQHALYGDQLLLEAGDVIEIGAPYRTSDDLRTQISGQIALPHGKMIESVSVILDNNPMPVSTVFDFEAPVPQFQFDVTMRINGPTPLHVVTKTTDGQLFVSETFVKTSGTGACAAPPGTDPELALATLGNMQLDVTGLPEAEISLASLSDTAAPADKMLNIAIDHPSHSGLQMDQISLLFIPARFIDTIDVDIDGQEFVDITGSISLSENPDIRISVPASAAQVDVELTDTDETVTSARKLMAGL